MIGDYGCISESESRMQEKLYESERKLKAEKYKIRIVSAWPDGVCCKTCKYWNEKGFGNGICDAVTIGADFGLVGGGQLRTFELFACSEWEAKESE